MLIQWNLYLIYMGGGNGIYILMKVRLIYNMGIYKELQLNPGKGYFNREEWMPESIGLVRESVP